MKKWIAWSLLLLLICGLMTACGIGFEDDNNGQDYFNGEVIEVRENYVLTRCLDVTSGALSPGTEVTVSREVVSARGFPEVETGDRIRVVFSGVQETDPAGLDTVFAVYLLDENGEVIL